MTSILRQAKLKLATIMKLKFASVETDKGTLYYDGEELVEGNDVYVMDEEGNQVLPEDGDYEAGEQVFVVENGVVIEIRDEADEPGEKTEKMQKEMPELTPEEEESGYVSVNTFKELLSIVSELVNELDEIKGEVSEEMSGMKKSFSKVHVDLKGVKSTISKVDGELKKALKMSKAEPINNEKTVSNKNRGQSQLDKFGIY